MQLPASALAVALVAALLAVPAFADVQTKRVTYKDGDVELEGYVAMDPAKVKNGAPGVLIIHQWMGLTEYEESRARQLAELGYVAFACDIYGKGVRPSNPGEAGKQAGMYRGGDRKNYRSRLKAGLDTLKKIKGVDTNNLAAIGYCFGGTGALEVARMGADVKGVVSFHGGLGAVDPAEAKQITAAVLVCHGADDPHVPDDEVAGFMKEMRDADVDWQFIAYGNSVHSFTQPSANSPTAKYNKKADMRSWEDMKDFFNEVFSKAASTQPQD